MTSFTRRSVLIGASLALALTGSAMAQDYPSGPITIVVGYAAGGGTDTALRAIAAPLSDVLGVRILVQNSGGAGGGVAAVKVSRAEPDGYTLLATTSSTFSLEPQVQTTAYKSEDFVHIATVSQFQGAVFAPASAPYNTYEELVAFAKDKGTLKHANYFQLDKLLMGYIAEKEGFKVEFVPVRGGNGAVQAVLSQSVDTAYSGGSWAPLASSGDVKPIFATSLDRLALAPDVPSMKDIGYEIGTTSYITISAPAGTPDNVVTTISDALAKVMDNEAVKNMGQQRFIEAKHWGPEETKEILAFEEKSFKEMFEAGN